MTRLFGLIRDQNIKATAVVGMTKNVGKTVTFNCLVKALERTATVPSLISAGYDGERFDRLTLKEKPRIYAPEGAFVATAKACFDAAEAELELVESSSFSTPLGLVCLARVKKAGLVELAGPGSVSALKELIDLMLGYGAEHVLVDGAINRLASASPAVTEATILATGAALGPTMDDVIRKTLFRRSLFESTRADDEMMCSAAQEGLKEGSAALLHRDGADYRIEPVRADIPLLAGARLIDKCRPETSALVYGGALVDGSLLAIMNLFSEPPAVIVRDATRLFLTEEVYNRFLSRGGKIMVLNRINLVAITLNPTDPGGRGYDPKMFLERMTEVLSPCPVFDLVFEKEHKLS